MIQGALLRMANNPTGGVIVQKIVFYANPETYHFFLWLLEAHDPEVLVAKAMSEIESSEYYDLGADPSTCAKEALTDDLGEILEGLKLDWEVEHHGVLCVKLSADERALMLPILKAGLDRIDLSQVAENLLRRMGKWAPDKEVPEVI
jgi:hypothetical protein